MGGMGERGMEWNGMGEGNAGDDVGQTIWTMRLGMDVAAEVDGRVG